jgi:hypothetical protein
VEIGTTSGRKIAVASMQRNEAKYILEWFSYYLLNGVNHFVIYNHQSTDDTQSIWERLKAAGYSIDIHYRTGYNVHYPMLEHALTQVLPTVDWLIFADMDEFYFSDTGRTVEDILYEYEKNFKGSALGVNWCAYGSSGHVADPEYVLRDFNHRGHADLSTNHHYKSIVRGQGLAGAVRGTNPHIFTTEHGTYNLAGNLIPAWAGHNPAEPVIHTPLRINHYQCKSWEYFKTVKQARGSTADRAPDAPGAQIPDSVFHDYDYNDVLDNTVWDLWGTKLVTKMQEIQLILNGD